MRKSDRLKDLYYYYFICMSQFCQYFSTNEGSSEGTPLDTISLTGQALLICSMGVEMGASLLFVDMKGPKGVRDPM